MDLFELWDWLETCVIYSEWLVNGCRDAWIQVQNLIVTFDCESLEVFTPRRVCCLAWSKDEKRHVEIFFVVTNFSIIDPLFLI